MTLDPSASAPSPTPRLPSSLAAARGAEILGVLGAFGTIAAVGWLDRLTGRDLSLSLLYLAPVLVVAWWFGRRWPVVLAVTAAAVGLLADLEAFAGHSLAVPLWNAFTRCLVFGVVGQLLAHERVERARLEEMTARVRRIAEREARLARVDPVTDLPNARAFFEALGREIAHARRSGTPITLAYVDVDGFKSVNDALGHATGDELLRHLGHALRASLRAVDFAGRIGGDEFGVLLVGADLDASRRVLARFAGDVDRLRAQYAGTDFGVSVGFASLHERHPDGEALVREADRAMYEAKARTKRIGRPTVAATARRTATEPLVPPANRTA